MNVDVLLFAAARDAAGIGRVEITLPPGATVADLRRCLGEQCPALRAWLPRMMIAVNADYASDDRPLKPGDEIACIPPVSGGQPAAWSQ